jgi:serine/threonine protein kinase
MEQLFRNGDLAPLMTEPIDPRRIEPPETGLRVGEYELLSRIAAGGMGEVFIARKTGRAAFEKRVALKLLLPHLSQEPELVHRFLDEARIAAQMNHPNLVQVFDVGEADGRHYLAMALVEGVSLARLLKACQRLDEPLPLPMVRLVAIGLCEGLAYAHDLKDRNGRPLEVVHRDINPYNVLVSAAGAVLVTDFGIAKVAGSAHATLPGRVLGKLAYLAPEQLAAGAQVDRRTDLYAAALTLYETATGVSPFQRDSEAATLDAVRQAPLLDPRERRPMIDPRMAAAILRAADRDPARRFSSAKAMLEELLDGPVARPSELGEQVELRCAQEIESLRKSLSSPTGPIRTRSLAAERISPAPHWRKRGIQTAVMLAAGTTAIGLALLSSHGQKIQAPDSAPATETPGAEASGGDAPVLEAPDARTWAQAPEIPAPKPTAVPSPPRSEKAGSAPPKKARVGYLSADASPWASVIVDGKEIDKTPISRYPLPVGPHQVVFRNTQLGKEQRKFIRIEENRVKSIYAELGP